MEHQVYMLCSVQAGDARGSIRDPGQTNAVTAVWEALPSKLSRTCAVEPYLLQLRVWGTRRVERLAPCLRADFKSGGDLYVCPGRISCQTD